MIPGKDQNSFKYAIPKGLNEEMEFCLPELRIGEQSFSILKKCIPINTAKVSPKDMLEKKKETRVWRKGQSSSHKVAWPRTLR